MQDTQISLRELDILKHTIGYDAKQVKGKINRKYEVRRNYFTCVKDRPIYWEALNSLTAKQLLTKEKVETNNPQEVYIFQVTDKAIEYLENVLEVKLTGIVQIVLDLEYVGINKMGRPLFKAIYKDDYYTDLRYSFDANTTEQQIFRFYRKQYPSKTKEEILKNVLEYLGTDKEQDPQGGAIPQQVIIKYKKGK